MNMNLSVFRNPKIINHRENGFVERIESLRNFRREVELAAQTNLNLNRFFELE
jgi:hypothetical protein